MADVAELQNVVFQFLGDSSTHGGEPVRRFDTHVSAVFLAGNRAYKVKRAVKLPFLDYSTLCKRERACRSELEVNQAFAPQLYRRVVPITRGRAGRLVLGGTGEPVEWAVEMLRFDEDRTLDRLADTGAIDPALADTLAAAVVGMHARAPKFDAAAWLAALTGFLDQNRAAFHCFPQLFSEADVQQLDQESRKALNRLRSLLSERGELGFVRRCHGDLHLGNIVLLNGEAIPFDAIEFDPTIAAGDVLYDLAFLLMDLVERGLDVAANIVLNGYMINARRDEHFDGLAALPFFMSLRAAIRAKVTAARLQNIDASKRDVVAANAKKYFLLALRLLSPPPPRLVAIGGLSGTGKSSVARTLAPLLPPIPGAVVLRSDVERKLLFGVEPTRRLSSDAYLPDVGRKVYELLTQKAARVVSAGHSVIVDAVFAKPDERGAIAAVAATSGASFKGIFLFADLNTRLDRIGSRTLDASDANAGIARQQESFVLGDIGWQAVGASGPLSAVLDRARDIVEPI